MGNYIETISYINPGDGLDHPIDAVTVGGLTLTSEEKELWSGKQDALTFDSIPTENSDNIVKSGSLYSVLVDNELVVATALNDLNDRLVTVETSVDSFAVVTESTVSGWGFTKNSGTVTGISMNGTLIGTSGIINLGTVLTSHQDITGKADTSAAIGSLSLSINSSNYQITLSGTKVDGTSFTVPDVIDLPLETMVVNGSYNDSTKKIELTLKNGNTVDFSVSDLVAGLQSEITPSNKLSADLISDGNTNKVVTATEKSTWNSAVKSVTFNGNSVSVSDGSISMSESDPVFSASPAASISAADISNWNSKTSNTGTLTGVTFNGTSASVSNGIASISVSIPAEVTEATVSGWGFTKNSGTLTSHAKHKLEIGSATATSAASNTITYVESLTGTTTATSGNLTITPTLKSISVPTVSQLVDELSSEFVKKPDIVYQYESGYSPIYGQGSDSFTNNWDLTNLDLSPYKYLKVFMKGSDHATNASALTAPIIITIPLDEGIIYSGTTVYYGVGVTLGINDQNRWFATFAGVDSTKTKFQILRTRSIYGTVGSNQDNNGRYLWRIEGWYDSEESGESGSSSFTELDPTVPSYVKNILQSDINSWNGKLSGVTFNGVSASVSNGVASISAETLPAVSSSDNGKVLMVDNGAWTKKDPVHLYSGTGTPSDLDGYDGDLYIDLT